MDDEVSFVLETGSNDNMEAKEEEEGEKMEVEMDEQGDGPES